MKTLIVAAFLLAIAQWQSVDALYFSSPACSDNALCWDRPAGWYTYGKKMQFFFYCNKWYQNLGCQRCPATHLVFSRKCSQCLSQADAKAGRCQTPPNQGGNIEFCTPSGFCDHRSGVRLYADANDKTRYFQCVNKKPTPCRSCAPGTVFNMVCQACMVFKTDKLSECTGGKTDDEVAKIPRCPDNVCKWRPVGDYELAQNSETYASCNAAGQCIKRWCPGNLVYSKVCESCQRTYIRNAKHCPSNKPPQTTTAPPAATEHPFCSSQFCKAWGALLRTPPNEAYEPAGTYYNCRTGGPNFPCIIQRCAPGTVFNEGRQACVFPHQPSPPKTTSPPPAATEHPFCTSQFCKAWGALLRTPPNEAYEPAGTYYNCRTGGPNFPCIIQRCAPGTVFNEGRQACVLPPPPKKW